MKIWEFLFGRPTYVVDEEFGRLQWLATDRKNGGYFEGSRAFRPTGHMLELSIDAPPTGPTDVQRTFYHTVEARYWQLAAAAQVLIEAELRHWRPTLTIESFRTEFWPVWLAIPFLMQGQTVEWELAFETHHDPDHTITVIWRDFEPYFVRIDG